MPKESKPWFYKQTGWWMTWLGNRKVRLAKGRSNLKAAKDRLADLLHAARHNPHPDCGVQTVASLIERYLDVAFKTLSVEAQKARKNYLQSFAEAHGFRPVDVKDDPMAVRKDHLQEWLLAHTEWVSDWTKRDAVRAVQAVFYWALDAEIIAKNPFRKMRLVEGTPRREMTEEEFRAILRTTTGWYRTRPTPGARFRQILFFLWFTGCRPKEASKLRWSEINFDAGVITLQKHKTVRMQKKPKPRIITLPPVAVKLLHAIRKHSDHEFVFANHRGNPWNRYSLGLRIRRARKTAGVSDDAKLYGMRHAFGTRGIVNGVDIKTLATLMGHETTEMTEHYLHLAGRRDFLAASMQQVGGLRPNA
ncbi:MAG TPA: tyrosine-type recombinase/integrase [Pirellulales bacterium]|jgi:integrase/recombinase XerC|nr:tyrosine-type recombinase/integrase [Pirellulales bacterium]